MAKDMSIVKVDSKRRLALPKGVSVADYYSVQEAANGDLVLSPRIMSDPREIVSKRTLHVIDEAMEHLDQNEAGKPIDLSQFTHHLRSAANDKKKKRKT